MALGLSPSAASLVHAWLVCGSPLCSLTLSLPLLLAKTQVKPSTVLQRLNVLLGYTTQNWAVPKLKVLLNEN